MSNPDKNAWVSSYESEVFSPEFWAPYEGQDLSDPASARLSTVDGYQEDPGISDEAAGWGEVGFDDSDWETMAIPGGWKLQGIESNGVIWFRKEVELPEEWAGKELELNLGAVDKQDITFFNGECVGKTGERLEEHLWNQERKYRIPANLVKAGKNVITVRAYSFVNNGGLIGPRASMLIAPCDLDSAEAIPLDGDWKYKMEHDFGIVTPGGIEPGPGCPNSPYMLFNNMIAPLVPYAISGAIWYQGGIKCRKCISI